MKSRFSSSTASVDLPAAPQAEFEAQLRELAEKCDELGLRPHLAEACLALAEICARRGEADRAGYFGERAVAEWDACAMPVHAENARRSLAAS